MSKYTQKAESMIERSLDDCLTAPYPPCATAWAEAQIEMAYALGHIGDWNYDHYRQRLGQMPGRREAA